MTNNKVITVPQLFCLLFISRMIVDITYNPLMASSNSMWDHVVSASISFVLTFLLFLPVYFLYKRNPQLNILDYAYIRIGKAGFVVAVLYLLYFIVISSYTLSLFDLFVSNVMDPHLSLFVLSLAVLLTACYGAFKGIEALARTSGIILIGVIASIVFLVCALFPQTDVSNYTPLFYDGPQATINGVLLMISRTSSIAMLAILLPFARGNVKKGFVVWNTSVFLVVIMLITLIVGALGDYLETQIFPVYTAASVAEIGMLKRLDALYLGVWTMGIFLKLALCLFLISLCAQRMFGKKAAKISILICAAVVLIFSLIAAESRDVAYLLYDMRFLLFGTLLVSVFVPLLFLIADLIKGKGEAKVEKKKI